MISFPIDVVSSLPFGLRVAWAASVVDRVLSFYSAHFSTTYYQRRAVDYAWSSVIGPTPSAAVRNKLLDAIQKRPEDEESNGEGYGVEEIMMGIELLYETKNRNGKSAAAAVENAVAAFAYQRLYRSGLTFADPRISNETVDDLGEPIARVASAALQFAAGHPTTKVQRGTFDELLKDIQCDPVNLAPDTEKSSRRPPIHELSNSREG